MPQDAAEAVRWFRLAAEQGDFSQGAAWLPSNTRAQYVRTSPVEGVPQDAAEAVRWYRLAAEQGHARAQYNLGAAYDTGEACRRTTRKPSGGTAWPPSRDTPGRRTTSELCTTPVRACRRTPRKPSGGTAWPPSRDTPWRRTTSDVRTGEGVPQDAAEAVRWFRLAAEQGHASAQYNLGVMYDTGEGVPQDAAEAVRWYRLAAEQGYASAQNNLGFAYGTGEGVPQDAAEAVRWFRLAAEQGHASAQNNLGFAVRHR